MAAEVLSQGGVQVDVYDSMPSVGRKFLLAGVGGMNITHAEAPAAFVAAFGRVLAEFWADGPRSETPPGHWNTLANEVADHPLHRRCMAGDDQLFSTR